MKFQKQPPFLFLNTSQLNIFSALFIISSTLPLSSCRLAELVSTVFAAQEWSQNYALMEGVTCSAQEMIDGDIKTFGSSGHQIRINLPQRKTIHRLVFRQTNIQDLTLYIDRNNDDENDWMKWEQIDANRESTIEIRKVFNAQRIRILIGATSDDQRIAEEFTFNTHSRVGIHRRTVERGKPFVHEIELYGFEVKESSRVETQVEHDGLF